MINFFVTTCHNCPFANNDNEYGRDKCNHPFNFGKVEAPEYVQYWELPKDKVHKNCPLKDESINVILKKS